MAAETQLDIVLGFKDEASSRVARAQAALDSFKKKVDDMGPTFQKMAAAGTVAFGALTAFGAKAVKDYAEAEKASAQLEYAVTKVTGATKEQFEATSALADALERKGVLDADNIKVGLAQLSTFGLSNKAVQGLGGALADLAVNQYGVSASGEQLASTANVIAKALNGQFGELQQSGIRFTEAQIKAIKYGNEMEKVKAINEGFAQNLKFTNEVALATQEGQMAKAAVAAGNLSEAIGSVLTPIVAELTKQIVPMLAQVQKWIEANPELTKRIVLGVAAVTALVAIIGTLGLVVPTIVAGFSVLTTVAGALAVAIGAVTLPMLAVIATIAALVAAGVYLYKHWDELGAKAKATWSQVRDWVNQKLNEIRAFIDAAMTWITNKINESSEAINAAWATVWNGVRDTLVSIMEGAKNVITGTINWVIGKLNSAIDLANQAIALANRVPGVNVSPIQNISPVGGARAAGGPVRGGTPYLVGENGPEVFMPNSSGAILPNRGGNGGVSVVVNVGNLWGGNPREAAREIGDMIIKQLQINRRVAT